jgi:hypothetical protein
MIVTYVAAAGLKAIDKSDIDTDGFISRLSHAALNAYGYSIVLTYLAIENALQRGTTSSRCRISRRSISPRLDSRPTAIRSRPTLVQNRLLEDI